MTSSLNKKYSKRNTSFKQARKISCCKLDKSGIKINFYQIKFILFAYMLLLFLKEGFSKNIESRFLNNNNFITLVINNSVNSDILLQSFVGPAPFEVESSIKEGINTIKMTWNTLIKTCNKMFQNFH